MSENKPDTVRTEDEGVREGSGGSGPVGSTEGTRNEPAPTGR